MSGIQVPGVNRHPPEEEHPSEIVCHWGSVGTCTDPATVVRCDYPFVPEDEQEWEPMCHYHALGEALRLLDSVSTCRAPSRYVHAYTSLTFAQERGYTLRERAKEATDG